MVALSFRPRNEEFDVVISNPPYFKIGKADPCATAASIVVHGQPNIYALFIAVGATLLRQGGDFITITPRSFASGLMPANNAEQTRMPVVVSTTW